MTTLLGILTALAAMALLTGLGHLHGSAAGFQRGYDKGRKDADAWWIGVENDADDTRRKIRREG